MSRPLQVQKQMLINFVPGGQGFFMAGAQQSEVCKSSGGKTLIILHLLCISPSAENLCGGRKKVPPARQTGHGTVRHHEPQWFMACISRPLRKQNEKKQNG